MVANLSYKDIKYQLEAQIAAQSKANGPAKGLSVKKQPCGLFERRSQLAEKGWYLTSHRATVGVL